VPLELVSARQHLQMEGEVRRDGGLGGPSGEDAGGREHAAEAIVADAMLDNAALRPLGRNGDARGRAESCRPSRGCLRDERTAGV